MRLAIRDISCLGTLFLSMACSPASSSSSSGPVGKGVGTNNDTSGAGGTKGYVPISTTPVINGTPIVPDDDPTNPNITHPTCGVGTCTDFPQAPILGQGVPSNAPDLFGAADNYTGGSLCVLEPQLSNGSTQGAMIPANWVRPRFHLAASGMDLFEIRIHSPAEQYDLVAYTKETTWYLPKNIWAGTPPDAGTPIAAGSGLANNAAGAPLTVTIRGVNSAAPGKPVGVTGDFNIAPVVATGSMVFWTVQSSQVTIDSSKLLGFTVGDEGVAVSLNLSQINWTGQIGEDGSVLRGYYDNPKLAGFKDGQVRCVGCHTSTPDGQGVLFTDDWPWAKAAAALTSANVGQIPSFLGAGAQAIMKMPWWGTQSMSLGHWSPGDRVLITSYATTFLQGEARTKPWQGLPSYTSTPMDRVKWHKLAWIDLESNASINVAVTDTPDYGQNLTNRETAGQAAMGSAYGLIATGDNGVSDVSPSINHGGDTIAYVATDYSPDGHPDYTAKSAIIKTVAYNNRQGGTAQPLTGASDPSKLQYYPSYSADDKLIAFTSAPTPSSSSPDGPYYNRFGQIMVVPAQGGDAMSLEANKPVACAGDNLSRGIINSWPKWSPDVFTAHGKTYYFLIFSSARKYGDEFSQPFQLSQNSAADFTGLPDSSQLYLAALVLDNASGQYTLYPAVYIWNQNRTPSANGAQGIQYSNLTPAWDPFQLPPLQISAVPSDVIVN